MEGWEEEKVYRREDGQISHLWLDGWTGSDCK